MATQLPYSRMDNSMVGGAWWATIYAGAGEGVGGVASQSQTQLGN